MNEHVCNCCKE
ncbi:YosB [Bacillus subtilis QB928]|nr:YosB [Bacillus subtilis QB928]